MALGKNFTQKYIDELDINNIPEDFVSYYLSLSEIRKQDIQETRPDVVAQIEGSVVNDDGINTADKAVNDGAIERIDCNPYESIDVRDYESRHLSPVILYTIPNKQKKCKIHKKVYEELNFRCNIEGFSSYGYDTKYCEECKKIFIEEADTYVLEKLSERGMSYTYYDLRETNDYIRSNVEEIELNGDSTLYVPDIWIEDNPLCPIHKCKLEEQKYVIKYRNRKMPFSAYYCEECDKPVIRYTDRLELEDKCGEVGVKFPKVESLAEILPKAKVEKAKKIKPQYMLEEGEIKDYIYDDIEDITILSETDTVIVNDAAYCYYDGHDTYEIIGSYSLKKKRGGVEGYVSLFGYCPQCQKYYMQEDDYKVIYNIGRPMVNIIVENEDEDIEYMITSGEIFNQEQKHLQIVEEGLTEEIDKLKSQPDYVDQYTKESDYELMAALQYQKKVSKDKYEGPIAKINGYKERPYKYRIDISCDGQSESFYIGVNDIYIDGKRKVLSFNNPLGRELSNYRTRSIQYRDKEYLISLSREFDIENEELFGYINTKTDEDVVFRDGVTDPFLRQVLKTRKKQHGLTDIIVSIQENQNKIVDLPLDRNIIVQGCAGSGKTMVLLHRLSSLQYNNEGVFSADRTLILTPNKNFNTHISGLADYLQLGGIKKVSVSEYFDELLGKYSKKMQSSGKVLSESSVNQSLVNYIYSSTFLDSFFGVYEKKKNNIMICRERINAFANSIGVHLTKYSDESDSDLIIHLVRDFDNCYSVVNSPKKSVNDTLKVLKDNEQKIVDCVERLSIAEDDNSNIVDRTLPTIWRKIDEAIAGWEKEVSDEDVEISQIEQEEIKVQRQLLPFGKTEKLSNLKKKKSNSKRKRTVALNKISDTQNIRVEYVEGLSQDKVIVWLRKFLIYIPSLNAEIRRILETRKRLKDTEEEYNAYLKFKDECNVLLEQYKGKIYPENLYDSAEKLKKEITEYTEIKIYNDVFEESIGGYISENGMKKPKGVHRFDLYVRLWFCIRFFNKYVGQSQLICVDEAQDVALNTYKLINELNNKRIIWNLYGDTNQLLKPGRGISNWTELRKMFDMDMYYLNENYRNTNQITRFCNDSFSMSVAQTGVDGPSVKELPRKELEHELSELKLGTQRVAILIPRAAHKSDYLNKNLIKNSVSKSIGNTIGNGHISLLYVDEVKGIEFEKVYVVTNKMSRNEKYIAYTRALQELVVVVDNDILSDDSSMEDSDE